MGRYLIGILFVAIWLLYLNQSLAGSSQLMSGENNHVFIRLVP